MQGLDAEELEVLFLPGGPAVMELRKEGSVAELATLITLGLVLVRPLIGEAEAQEVAAAIMA